MFKAIFQILILGILGVLAYEFFKGDSSQSWSYCGAELKKEKQKMERLVAAAKREVGSGAEVTWKEDASCISANVKNNQRISTYLVNKIKASF